MRVRPRLGERLKVRSANLLRISEKRHDEPKQEPPSLYGMAAVAFGFERCIFIGKRGGATTLGGGL